MFTAFSVSVPAFGNTPVDLTSGVTIDQACICKVVDTSGGGSPPTVYLYGDISGSGTDGWPVQYGNGTSPTELRLLPGDHVYALSSSGSGSQAYVMIYSAPEN